MSFLNLVCAVTLAVATATCEQTASLADDSQTAEAVYLSHVGTKLLKMYFPPHSPWAYVDSSAKVRLEKDGKLYFIAITKPPLVRGRKNTEAEMSLRSAVSNANPVPVPPNSMHPPVELLVKFKCKSKINGGFECQVIEILSK